MTVKDLRWYHRNAARKGFQPKQSLSKYLEEKTLRNVKERANDLIQCEDRIHELQKILEFNSYSSAVSPTWSSFTLLLAYNWHVVTCAFELLMSKHSVRPCLLLSE